MTLIPTALALSAALAIGVPQSTTASKTAPKSQTQTVARPSDSDLKDRIEHRLDNDAAVHKYDLSVSVDNGVATLKGTVATAAQKAAAVRLARVTGVTRVVDQITVDPNVDKGLAEKTKSGLSKTGEAINDAWITTKVHYHFMGEDLLKGSDINVDTNNHVVTLNGTVKTVAGRTRAVELARMTDGVQRVVDNLKIGVKK